MNFNLTDLQDLLLCARENNLQCISIEQKDFALTINKAMIKDNLDHSLKSAELSRIAQISTKRIKKEINAKAHKSDTKTEIIQDAEVYFTIVSPMVGTFYRSPAPNESAFININEKVKVNQTVCIVEAMKLMNEIEAEVSGEIVEILVKDGDIIDCGQALMKIKPEGQ